MDETASQGIKEQNDYMDPSVLDADEKFPDVEPGSPTEAPPVEEPPQFEQEVNFDDLPKPPAGEAEFKLTDGIPGLNLDDLDGETRPAVQHDEL